MDEREFISWLEAKILAKKAFITDNMERLSDEMYFFEHGQLVGLQAVYIQAVNPLELKSEIAL